jgi:putative ABC transport system permease protein
MVYLKQLAGRLRAFWKIAARSRQLDHDMRDEMRFHIDMEAQRLAEQDGLDPLEARRLAGVRFGGVETFKEAARDGRGRRWLDSFIADLRLAVRMLIKYKGLTLVGGLAMAVAIGIGATAFEVFGEMLSPALPFEEGDRVVAVQYSSTREDGRNPLLDVFEAKDRLVTMTDVAAFRSVQHNLDASPASPLTIRLAQISAAGIALTRTAPLHGRIFVAADEDPASPPVLLLSYRAWQTQFSSDPNVVGRAVMLSGVAHTVIGVMPDGFAFPIAHQYWIPLPVDAVARNRPNGPTMYAFGRLAGGASIEQAQAELTALAARHQRSDAKAGDGNPAGATVAPYTHAHVDLTDPALVNVVRAAQLITSLLAFVVAINLAILFHARTVTRAGELAVRSALGASRARLLAQLFVEALALALVGAAVGLGIASIALRNLQDFARVAGGVPFWIQFELSAATVVNAFVLAALTALIMGVVPGLRATGRRLSAALTSLEGRGAPRLGRLWTTLVGAQVAAAVAVLPVACFVTWQTLQMEFAGPGFAADKFIVARVGLPDDDGPADEKRVTEGMRQLMSDLRAEPGVSAVTFSTYVPGFAGGAQIDFETAGSVAAPAPWYVSRLDVAVDMLDVYGAQVLAGRTFNTGDTGPARAVVVNESFTRWLPAGASALGAQFRYVQNAGASVADSSVYEVVGVVRDFPQTPEALNLDTPAVVFHAAELGAVNPVFLSLRYDQHLPPDAIEPRIRELSLAVDPAIQVTTVQELTTYYEQVRGLWRLISWSAAIATFSGLLLSAAGMYALMSFAVAQRIREIGIRVALGASPRRLFIGIFGRAFRQLGLGILAGWVIAGVAIMAVGLDLMAAAGLLAAVALIMLIVGLLSAVGPARRSLRVQPSEALRS